MTISRRPRVRVVKEQCKGVQCGELSVVYCNAVRWGAVRCSAVQRSAVQWKRPRSQDLSKMADTDWMDSWLSLPCPPSLNHGNEAELNRLGTRLFFIILLILDHNSSFLQPRNVTCSEEIMHVIRHKWNKVNYIIFCFLLARWPIFLYCIFRNTAW